MGESAWCHGQLWVMESSQNTPICPKQHVFFCCHARHCCRLLPKMLQVPNLTYILSAVLLAELRQFRYRDVPRLSVLSFSFRLPRYGTSRAYVKPALPHATSQCWWPMAVSVSSPARGSHPQYGSHRSICGLLREQTGFRSHILNESIKTIAVALEENNHVLIQKHRLMASLLFTCLRCHNRWKDPSCFWAAKVKNQRFATLGIKGRNRRRCSQVPQLVREHEQAGLLPAKGSRQVGQEMAVAGRSHFHQQ